MAIVLPVRPPGPHRQPAAAPVTGLRPGRTGDVVTPADAPAGRDARVGALFDEHYVGLCRLASLLLGDRAAAEEAVQDAFLRTYTGWWRIRRPERAQWYLRRAVVNQCRSRQRRRVNEDRGNRVVYQADGTPRPGQDPTVAVESVMVAAAVAALPPRQRETVVLRYFEDLSEADIAQLLGCSTGTVKSQLSKARSTLAESLADLRAGAD